MSRFKPETVERVKEAADIVEIVSAYTDLRRTGERHMGLCPFHEERTPSFSVDPREKLYHCFGCGVGGDVIKFVEEKEGLAFPEAVEALGDATGWRSSERRPPRPSAESSSHSLSSSSSAREAGDFFSTSLRARRSVSSGLPYKSGSAYRSFCLCGVSLTPFAAR